MQNPDSPTDRQLTAIAQDPTLLLGRLYIAKYMAEELILLREYARASTELDEERFRQARDNGVIDLHQIQPLLDRLEKTTEAIKHLIQPSKKQ